MELRQFEYLVAVAEEASFTRAAERVHVAQPAVSAQIRRLEREFGQDLFDRSGRTVRLTEVGETVLPFARAALAAVSDARLAVDELAGLVRGHVAVGMITSCGSLDLPAMLAEFHARYPGVEITLTEANSDQLVRSLLSGDLDLALIGFAGDAPEGVEVHVVVDEELVVAVPHGTPFAGLREHGLVSLPPGTGLRAALDNACAAAGFRPRIAFEASDPTMLAEIACRGLGPAILPASLAAAYADRLTGVEVGLRSYLGWAWRAEGPASPAARALQAFNSARC
ncbi:LysR family transcriptional regulator [Lentzea tibetensis]|uniref:LysR family transcriptional regulator n=1 Tax=Lentzea tibetensis TaxID=2591470 RepID=A0A563F0E6_9PSEU|nr:LysR family transcriptional regulator [Lentzea tibetensis]TWP53389.1 LysR family transcriptional regulator [Lentzea tibetensis]